MDGCTVMIFVIFFACAFLGFPIAMALTLGSLIPLMIYTNVPLESIAQKFYTGCDVFSLMAIPLFILCGGLMAKTGVSKRLCDFLGSLFSWLPGGLAIVSFLVCMFFGAISGSATATVVAIGSIMVPAMIEEGYEERFALAAIAVGGILGSIIPPSIPMVVYGNTSGASIADIFTGGILPGVLLTLLFSIYSFFYGKKHVKSQNKFEAKRVWVTFKEAIWGLLMPVIILGGIYGGIFTPTEAAAVASVYGIIVGFLVYRELDLKKFYTVLKESSVSGAYIMLIVAAATGYGYVMTRQQIPLHIAEAITSVTTNKYVFLLLVNILLLIIGTFMETCASILIVTPMLVPLCNQFGIDLVAFGVIMCVNLAIGFVTPPLGLNLYVSARLRNKPVGFVINKHLFALIGISIVVVLILSNFESVVLFLPNLLRG